MEKSTARAITQTVMVALLIVASRDGWGSVAGAVTTTTVTLTAWFHNPPGWLQFVGVAVALMWAASALSDATRPPKDGQRLFTVAQRAEVFERAGYRCEHKPVLWPRCRTTATHADHVHPHSKGGPTALSNAQALCAHHNLAKSAHVPTSFSLWRLKRRRSRYFPTGSNPRVSRRNQPV